VSNAFSMNSYVGKQILALVREGDFAHAGEEEAITLAMDAVAKAPDQHILDAGCGRGGTAAYMQAHGWGRVTGIDVEPKSIAYARATYPDVTFQCCRIEDVATDLQGQFDVVTLFNVLYALPDHVDGLRALAARAAPKARLVVFDYVDLGTYQDAPLIDSGKPFLPNPLKQSDLGETLMRGGWRLQAVKDLNEDYARRYVALVDKITAKREAIEVLAGGDAFAHVLDLYSGLLSAIRQGRLGGAVITAERSD